MAEKVHDDFERDRRVEIVGDTFLETGLSTRKLASYISTDNKFDFKVSNATVSDYIKRYCLRHPKRIEQINSLIEANSGSSLKDERVIRRVKKVYELICEGYKIEDIAKLLETSYWVTYYDVDIRLKKLDIKSYDKAKEILEYNSRSHNVIKSEEL